MARVRPRIGLGLRRVGSQISVVWWIRLGWVQIGCKMTVWLCGVSSAFDNIN